jgi:hypothetical protein
MATRLNKTNGEKATIASTRNCMKLLQYFNHTKSVSPLPTGLIVALP